ncbi:MAG: KH domain-containing protein [Acidimicrobiia bacterium]|nr:KH domain-containing protein [Acidimicrobiia bacterium]
MSDLAPKAHAVLNHLCKSIVDHPEEVSIETSVEGDKSVRFDVSVNGDDMGRVIGRRGRVASAIRTIVNAAGSTDGVSCKVEFVD